VSSPRIDRFSPAEVDDTSRVTVSRKGKKSVPVVSIDSNDDDDDDDCEDMSARILLFRWCCPESCSAIGATSPAEKSFLKQSKVP